jgi:ribonucleoside-diphosphate reductase alpha chain
MSAESFGPRTEFGQLMHATKYRAPEERFDDYCVRYARAVSDDDRQFRRTLRYLRDQVILPAGRQQHSVGRPYLTTAMNCYVGPTIDDSFAGIMDALKLAGMTLRTGGGCGWDFSTLRPQGEPIRGLGHGSFASGPLSFMDVWNTMCETILTAGHRRGAMMGVLRCDHPDILKFVNAKRNSGRLKNFNISVGITEAFMEALDADGLYDLKFHDTVHTQARAVDVWSTIMENNWDWAEPGVLFIDRINERNPLYYCEQIAATNPCGEVPLPPHGACLLGSLNVVKLLVPSHVGRLGDYQATDKHSAVDLPAALRVVDPSASLYGIDFDLLDDAIDCLVRACDAVIDITNYPLAEQQHEEQQKRRMGIGVTGMANAIEVVGFAYGTNEYIALQEQILARIAHQAYRTSIELAREKGPFPLFDADKYLAGWFAQNRLNDELRDGIRRHGLRNSHLGSIAPTGTISMAADNVSSGIEPPYALRQGLRIFMPDGQQNFTVADYALLFFGIEGRTANDVSAQDHIRVLCGAQRWIDQAVSKTCNVNGQIAGSGPGIPFGDFKDLYLQAYHGGAKGCTTFNRNGKLMGVRHDADVVAPPVAEGAACTFDELGQRTCAAD